MNKYVLHESTTGFIMEKLSVKKLMSGMLEDEPMTQASAIKTHRDLRDKIRGHAFKGTPLKNTRGEKNQELIDTFSGCEFLVDSLSGKYIYGYPVGFFGDENYGFQFDHGEVLFWWCDPIDADHEPNIGLVQTLIWLGEENITNAPE